MRVIFGDFEAMLSELKEREISEVRIEALYDERYDKHGVPFLKLYITIQALISETLYAHYEKVTFYDIKPVDETKVKEMFNNLKDIQNEIKNFVKESSFTVRCGHFQDGSER